MAKTVIRISAYLEIDIDKIIQEICHDSGCDITDVTMDQIFYYVSENSTYVKGKAPGVYEVADGPNMEGFDERSYDKIEALLEERKENNG